MVSEVFLFIVDTLMGYIFIDMFMLFLLQTWYIYYGSGKEPIIYMSMWGMVICMFVLGLAIGVVLAVGMLLYFQVSEHEIFV